MVSLKKFFQKEEEEPMIKDDRGNKLASDNKITDLKDEPEKSQTSGEELKGEIDKTQH